MANAPFWLGFMLPLGLMWIAFLVHTRWAKRAEAHEREPTEGEKLWLQAGPDCMHRVVVFRPGEAPTVEGVECFEEIRDRIVRGYVEMLRFGRWVALVDEDGRLKRCMLNRRVHGQWILGTFVVAELDDEGALGDLTPEDVELILARAALEQP